MEESDRLDQARALLRERLGRYQTNLELPIQVRPLDPDEAIGKDRYWGVLVFVTCKGSVA